MSKKKILITMSDTLFPQTMASQARVYHMIKRLSRDHTVDVVTHVRDERELKESLDKLKDVCRNFYPLPARNPRNNRLKWLYHSVMARVHYYLFGTWRRHYYVAGRRVIRRLADIVKKNNYDIVQIEYSSQSELFKHIGPKVFKVIDTQSLGHAARVRFAHDEHGETLPFFLRREIKKFGVLENEAIRSADLVISVSRQNQEVLREVSPHNDNLVIYSGMDIDYFKSYETAPEPKTIVFYGNMGTWFNVGGFFRFHKKILPLIKQRIPDVKVMVVGAHPSPEMKALDNGQDMIVTGFVDDVRDYLGKATVMVLPLDISGGFRSRIVDVMAMGIPVVGTHNALDSVEMTDGVHGYVRDGDEEMAEMTAKIIEDPALRKK